MEPHTIGQGMKVADCTPVINAVEVRDTNVRLDRPRRGSPEYVRNWPDPICEIVKRSGVYLEEAQREGLHKLINQHLGIFSLSPEDIGRTGLVKYQIHTGEAWPIPQPARRLSWSKREEADEQIERCLMQAEPSGSPWISPVVLKRRMGPRVSTHGLSPA